jgi:hypothetical protein
MTPFLAFVSQQLLNPRVGAVVEAPSAETPDVEAATIAAGEQIVASLYGSAATQVVAPPEVVVPGGLHQLAAAASAHAACVIAVLGEDAEATVGGAVS